MEFFARHLWTSIAIFAMAAAAVGEDAITDSYLPIAQLAKTDPKAAVAGLRNTPDLAAIFQELQKR